MSDNKRFYYKNNNETLANFENKRRLCFQAVCKLCNALNILKFVQIRISSSFLQSANFICKLLVQIHCTPDRKPKCKAVSHWRELFARTVRANAYSHTDASDQVAC